MAHADGLRELIGRLNACQGAASLAVPTDVRTGLAELITAPRVFEIIVAGDDMHAQITPELRRLAAMRDAVVDAHAGWLITVLLHAAGIPPQHDDTLPPSTEAKLTPEGCAWLVQQTMDTAATELQRSSIQMALHVGSVVRT